MKALKIVQLILYLVLIVFLVGIIIVFVNGKMNFNQIFHIEPAVQISETTEKSSDIEKISTELLDVDIRILEGSEDQVRVVYLGPKSEMEDPKVTVSLDGDELRIVQEGNTFQIFQWTTTSRTIEIYVPENCDASYDLRTASGDLKSDLAIDAPEFSLKLLSGDVSLTSLETDKAQINLTSGSLSMDRLIANTTSIDAKSGDINIGEFESDAELRVLSGDVNITSFTNKLNMNLSSGDILISSFSGSGDIHTTAGSIDLQIVESNGDLDISSTSGDVSVKLSEAVSYRFDVKTVAGDVTTNIPTINSGDNHVSGEIGEDPAYELTVQVTAGDVLLND